MYPLSMLTSRRGPDFEHPTQMLEPGRQFEAMPIEEIGEDFGLDNTTYKLETINYVA